jgi:hypothetical protein
MNVCFRSPFDLIHKLIIHPSIQGTCPINYYSVYLANKRLAYMHALVASHLQKQRLSEEADSPPA